MIRLYLNEKINVGQLDITGNQHHYVCHVLRVKVGCTIHIFNERDGEWKCEVISISKKVVTLEVFNCTRATEKLSFELSLAFCLLKPDAMHLVFEKGTELGVTEFIPLISEHTYIKKLNLEKYQKVIINATQQCERLDLPKILEPIAFFNFCKEKPHALIAFERMEGSQSLLDLTKSKISKDICICIGPEGGWSKNERSNIADNMQTFTLGKNILRAETAAIGALAVVIAS